MANKKVKNDKVQNPKHYSRYKIQPVSFIVENQIPYCEANAIKYLCRWRYKHKTTAGKIEDLNKAIEYINILLREQKDRKKLEDIDPLQIIS